MCDEDEPDCRVSTEIQGHCGSDGSHIMPITRIKVGFFLFFELPIHYNKTANMKKMNFLIWVMQVVYWTFTRATNPIDSGQSLRLQRLKHIVIRIKSIKLCFTLQY